MHKRRKVQALKPKTPKFPPLYRLLLTPGQVETDSSCFDRWVLKQANNAVNRRRMAIYVSLTKVKRKNRNSRYIDTENKGSNLRDTWNIFFIFCGKTDCFIICIKPRRLKVFSLWSKRFRFGQFDSTSLFFAPKPYGNTCYTGYGVWLSLLLGSVRIYVAL